MTVEHAETGNRAVGGHDRVYPGTISEEALGDVHTVLDRARELLVDAAGGPPGEVHDLSTAAAALDAVWRGAQAAAAGDQRAAERVATADDLTPFLLQVKQTDDRLQRERERRQSSALRSVQVALNRLQHIDTVSALIAETPAVVCTLGFDRAIVSRIHESVWVTEALHVEGDREWAEEILRAGRAQPARLVPGLFETEIVRRKRAVRVTDVQRERRVHRAVADASASRAYVAAPIMPRAQVIGFLHADRYFGAEELTNFDRDVLALFSEGFGYALERAILLDRLNGLHEKVLAHNQALMSIMDDSGHVLPPTVPVPRAQTAERDYGEDGLTRRETEVLRLLSAGHTNARIADALIISEGTVKSHVKHILRKLGAANRAEAVSVWLNRPRR